MTIQKADPEFRKKFLWLCVIAAVVAMTVISGLPTLEILLEALDMTTATRVVQVALVLLFLPALLATFYVFRLARQIKASRQFPPPGMKVVRDTQIVRGEPAVRKGQQLLVLSIVLLVLAFASIIYLPYLVGEIGERAARTQGFDFPM